MGGIDCVQFMIYVKENNFKVDVFIVYIDCEIWVGFVYLSEVFKQYRVYFGIDVKLIVCVMIFNGFILVDFEDRGMLDMVGFDLVVLDIIRQFVEGF